MNKGKSWSRGSNKYSESPRDQQQQGAVTWKGLKKQEKGVIPAEPGGSRSLEQELVGWGRGGGVGSV